MERLTKLDLEEETIVVSLETLSSSTSPKQSAAEITNIKKSVATKMQSDEALRLEQFNKFLAEAIEEVLCSLGEPVKNTFYQHLEDDFGITKSLIPQRICDFSRIIHKIFGLGASRLEIKFVKSLDSRIKVTSNWPECNWPLSKWICMEVSFEEYLGKMRSSYVMHQ